MVYSYYRDEFVNSMGVVYGCHLEDIAYMIPAYLDQENWSEKLVILECMKFFGNMVISFFVFLGSVN